MTDTDLMYSVLSALLKQCRPNENDAVLTPIWTKLVAMGLQRYAHAAVAEAAESDEPSPSQHLEKGLVELVGLFIRENFVHLLATSDTSIVISEAGKAFAGIARNAITDSMVQARMDDANPLFQLLHLVHAAVKDIRFREALPSVIDISACLFEVYNPSKNPVTLQRLSRDRDDLVHPILEHLVALRDDASYHSAFPCKAQLEAAITAAVRGMGFRRFSERVPLNIESGTPKRPYLLSLFASAAAAVDSAAPFGPHDLEYFSQCLIPLSSRLFAQCAAMKAGARDREGKMFETLGVQVWQLFPVICASVPRDVARAEAFMGLVEQICAVLAAPGGQCVLPADVPDGYATPDLRPLVCAGLAALADAYVELESRAGGYGKADSDELARGMQVLKEASTGLLARLCNNFTSPDALVIEKLVDQVKAQKMAKKGGTGVISPAGLVASAKNLVLQNVHEKANQKCELAIRALLRIADPEVLPCV